MHGVETVEMCTNGETIISDLGSVSSVQSILDTGAFSTDSLKR